MRAHVNTWEYVGGVSAWEILYKVSMRPGHYCILLRGVYQVQAVLMKTLA